MSAATGATAATVLVVDDDPAVAASLEWLLRQAGYRTAVAGGPAEALDVLGREPVTLVLQDLNFSRATSGEEGLDLLARIRARHGGVPVVLMTAFGSIELAVRGIKAGASDFVTKPWTHQQILASVKTALGLAEAGPAPSTVPTRAGLDARYHLTALAGEDPKLLRVLELVGRVAGTDASVLVTGESGTGKELVAAALHANGPRRAGPFVKVNLGGVSASLFESEMFGHVRGAFTDARADRKGRFELANGGTIFLDEIGDLEPASQVKLLRVLQDRTYEVLGDSRTRSVDVRVVSATNRDLPGLVASGEFREDLLYRLNLIAVELPPLRERRGDVPLLARRFLAEAARAYERPGLAFTEAALRHLAAQPWPGNVRQLRQVVERAVLVSESGALDVPDLERTLRMEGRERAEGGTRQALPDVGAMTLDEIEKAMIEKSLAHHGGNLSRVAEALGLSRAALYRRLEKYGLSA